MVDIGDAIGEGMKYVFSLLDWIYGGCLKPFEDDDIMIRNNVIICMFILFVLIVLDFLRVGRKWRKKLIGDSEFCMCRLYWLAIPVWLFVFGVLMAAANLITLLYLKVSGATYYPPQ
ncbi:MAG: hypothetical protein IJT83_03645 [Victivallales bacterium]|nr:hypothetical protein [Victivallales bacterium]